MTSESFPHPVDIYALQTPEPHYISHYTGYAPQYRYRIGHLTHRLLIDPQIHHAQKLVLSNRSDYAVAKPRLCELDLIRRRADRIDPIYTYPMTAGYAGFVPRTGEKFGNRFSISAIEGLSDLEKAFLDRGNSDRKMKIRNALARSCGGSRSIGDRSVRVFFCTEKCLNVCL